MVRALAALGHGVSVEETVEDRFDPDVAFVPPRPPSGSADAVLTFSDPLALDALRSRWRSPLMAFLVFEASRWPPAWVRAAAGVDVVAVPSRYCRDTLIDSGFPTGGIVIVPHGVDPALYHPFGRRAAGASDTLRVLFVGTPARRKGIDLLLDAWERAFSPQDAPTLIVKTCRYSDVARRPYLFPQLAERIGMLARRGFRVALDGERRNEAEMAALYRSADLLVHPFRSEGFCLPLLEAMACGTPVLASSWSGPADFLSRAHALLLTQRRRAPASGLVVPDVSDSWVHEPDLDELVESLRSAVRARDRLAKLGANGARVARAWTWSRAAAEVAHAFQALGTFDAPPETPRRHRRSS